MEQRIACAALTAAVLFPAVPPATVRAGESPERRVHAGARWEFSGDRGQTWARRPPVVPAGKRAILYARTTINVPDPAGAKHWTLDHSLRPARLRMRFKLNGTDVPVPLEGMYYRAIPAVPSELLRQGRNELTAQVRIDNTRPRRIRGKYVLVDYRMPLPQDPATLIAPKLKIQTGPILGACGEDHFTVACRTNLPATVTLTAEPTALTGNKPAREPKPIRLTSEAGLFHRFRATFDRPHAAFRYRLTAAGGGDRDAVGPFDFALPVPAAKARPDGAMRFVIAGDSRSNTDEWARVAAAILAEKPDLLVFTGDMNDHGTSDWEWDAHYLGPEPARRLLATVPYYPVWGNHEENAPVMERLFHTPSPGGADVNWAQQIGPVLLIGIDGRPEHRWQNPRWIDRALSGSKAKFIFFVSHYPAYSSGSNGELDEKTGEPEDGGYRIARRTLLPRLRKHRATAFVVAHEHCYERSDLPGGLVQICSAGAGAPRTKKQDDDVARRQNPYSKVFAPVLHYSLFEVRGDTCTFTAKTPDGRVLDRLTFRARKPQ